MLKMLGVTAQNLVDRATRRLNFGTTDNEDFVQFCCLM